MEPFPFVPMTRVLKGLNCSPSSSLMTMSGSTPVPACSKAFRIHKGYGISAVHYPCVLLAQGDSLRFADDEEMECEIHEVEVVWRGVAIHEPKVQGA